MVARDDLIEVPAFGAKCWRLFVVVGALAVKHEVAINSKTNYYLFKSSNV